MATGYERKYAIRLLNGPDRLPALIQRQRKPRYGAAVQEALMLVWRAANGICSKRPMPFLPELVPILERQGHLNIDPSVRAQLLSMSAATATRVVATSRQRLELEGETVWQVPVLMLPSHCPTVAHADV